MNILVFNVGSTTLKYACVDPVNGTMGAAGLFDRIGQPGGDSANHVAAARDALATIGTDNIDAIGHRIVQGGDQFPEPTVVTEDVLPRLQRLDTLAPLHNPSARRVVDGLTNLGIPQVLVFDTSYFASLSPAAYRYAVPEDWYRDHGVRRYGFHGTSHQYVVQEALQFIHGDERTRVISLHLGGGASVTASIGGIAIDTSMGMTPLEGLVMATRSGDLDPAIVLHMIQHAGMTTSDVAEALNKRSGLTGLCGDCDMRSILQRCESNDENAELALQIYIRRIIKTIGGYFAILGGLDALVFTAGIGENSRVIRQRIAEPLAHLGIVIDDQLNTATSAGIRDISAADSTVSTVIVPTNEELAIARETARLCPEGSP